VSQSVSVRLYADVVHGYSRGVLRGVAEYAKIHGWWDFSFRSRIEPDFTSALKRDGVRGVIIQIRQAEQAQELIDAGVAAVNVSHMADPLALPAVFPDDLAAGQMAAEYFLDRGFRSFAFVGFASLHYSLLRARGFIDRIRVAGFDCPTFLRSPETLETGGVEEPEKADYTDALNDLPRPLAIFCCNDTCARQIVQAAVRLGLQVPDEIAVLGVDNDEINCELSGVPLSSVQLNTEQIGYHAASMLARLIAGQPAPAAPMFIAPVQVITRRSTDVLALVDAEVSAAVRFIRDRGGREINVEDLLQRTSLSRRSLEMRFRKALGRSPYQEIRRVQMERAKLLLSHTDRSVREVADACGFKETRQLSTVFHDRVGVTPRQYRRRSRRNSQEFTDSQVDEPVDAQPAETESVKE